MKPLALYQFRDVFRTQLNIYDEAFWENSEQLEAVNYFLQKRSVVDLSLVSKHATAFHLKNWDFCF